MNPTLWVVGILVVVALLTLTLLFFLWGVGRIRKRIRDAEELALGVSSSDIPELVAECQEVFAARLGVPVSMDRPEEAMRTFEQALSARRSLDTALAFEKPGHPGWYVRPMGAFLGELIRRNVRATASEWGPSEFGGLCLHLGQDNERVTLFPFDKILKQQTMGDPGDLLAYLETARVGPAEILRRSQSTT